MSGWHKVNCFVERYTEDFEEFSIGVFRSYLKQCISNKISKSGSLRSCGQRPEPSSPNASELSAAVLTLVESYAGQIATPRG